jgi:hypothetical protein
MRLEITVQNSVSMATPDSSYDLPHKGTNGGNRQAYPFGDIIRLLELIHVGLQIMSYIFKDQV